MQSRRRCALLGDSLRFEEDRNIMRELVNPCLLKACMLVPSLPQSADRSPISLGLNARFSLSSLGNAWEPPQYAGSVPCRHTYKII